MADELSTVRDSLVARIDRWLRPVERPGPVEAEIAFMRSCAALHEQLRVLYPDLAEDSDALKMLQGICVETVRCRTGSLMPTAGEGATPGLSIGTAEAVAAARLAVAGQARDVLVTTSIMSQGLDCPPGEHLRGVPAHLWVLPAVCSALSPNECFSEEALDNEPPPTSYSCYGEDGTLRFRLGYEVRVLSPNLSDDEREQFRATAYEDWVCWAEAHGFDPDDGDPTHTSTFEVMFTENAFGIAANACGLDLPAGFVWSPDGCVRRAREGMGNGKEILQAAHLYFWAATESHLLLAADDDLDAVLREHPWISQWYPEALEDPESNSDPIWPPDKGVLREELDTRLELSGLSGPWTRAQSVWTWQEHFNVESGFAVVTNNTSFRQCSCWDEALMAASIACGSCGRPAGNRVATRAGAGDGNYPVYRLAGSDASPHGAMAVFDIGMLMGGGGPFSPSGLVDRSTPVYCGTIENFDRLSFCEASTGTDHENSIVSVALPVGAYHVVVWEGEDHYQALAAYDDHTMATLTDVVGKVGTTVWD